MTFICDICEKTYVTHLDDTSRCYTCETSEKYWREKIAEEIKNVWEKYPLKDYYSNDLAIKTIAEHIGKRSNEDL